MKRKRRNRQVDVRSFLCAAALVCAATGIGWVFRLLQFPETNIVVVYILSVILTARFSDGYLGYSGNGAFNLCLQYLFYTAVLYDVCG